MKYLLNDFETKHTRSNTNLFRVTQIKAFCISWSLDQPSVKAKTVRI